MPRGVYERQPAELDDGPGSGTETVKMVPMKLERHYRPLGDYEVVGYMKPEVTRKMPNGELKVVEKEEFVPGEQAPAPFPGVVSTGKVWARTTIKLPEAEAKHIRKLGIASVEFD